ncbi:MAG: DUF937 domain-containing protein [Gammaproteobacteria bacterium]
MKYTVRMDPRPVLPGPTTRDIFMNIMDILNSAQGTDAGQAMAANFGLDAAQTRAVMDKLVPALGAGLQKNIAQPGGLEALSRAVQNGGHSRYLEQASALTGGDAIQDGNAILGHLFGSKDVSRGVAQQAAADTGVDYGVVKQMLPMVAAAVMGAMGQQGQASGAGGLDVGGLLGSLFGGSSGGSAADDLLGMAGKFFGR